jgi:hypothetical protein
MGECFFNGIIGVAAPETLAETFSLPNIREGSLAHLCFEFVGAGLLSIAVALYLARFTRRPAHDIVAFASLPSAFVAFRHFLKGTPSRIGYRRGIFEVFLAYYVIGIEMILSRKGDTMLVSKIFASIPAVIGLNGMLDRSFARAIWGINIADGTFVQRRGVSRPAKQYGAYLLRRRLLFRCHRGCISLDVPVRLSSQDKVVGCLDAFSPSFAFFVVPTRINFQCSILYLLLLNGFDPLKSAGYIALTYAFQCIDFAFITKDREGYPNQPEWLMKLFVIIWTVTGIGLLRD